IAELKIELKYVDGEPVIREIARVSKPGRRVYSKLADLPRVYNGLGISILSTPHGVMSDNEDRVAKVSGEVPCRLFYGLDDVAHRQTSRSDPRRGPARPSRPNGD